MLLSQGGGGYKQRVSGHCGVQGGYGVRGAVGQGVGDLWDPGPPGGHPAMHVRWLFGARVAGWFRLRAPAARPHGADELRGKGMLR